jgi:hypothetical protein
MIVRTGGRSGGGASSGRDSGSGIDGCVSAGGDGAGASGRFGTRSTGGGGSGVSLVGSVEVAGSTVGSIFREILRVRWSFVPQLVQRTCSTVALGSDHFGSSVPHVGQRAAIRAHDSPLRGIA